MPAAIPTQLTRYQSKVVHFVRADGAAHYQRQFHPDLSPSGWHLGHCVFTENYWIREVLENDPVEEEYHALYFPEFSRKPARGGQLPQFSELLHWADTAQRENQRRLGGLFERRLRHPLLRAGYLITFLVQHYAQHFETLCQVRAQRRLQTVQNIKTRRPLSAVTLPLDTITVEADDYRIGAHRPHRPYDNEHPAHTVHLERFRIARHPVTNAEYLAFMQDGGYRDRRYWTASGWAWRRRCAVVQPCYWRRNAEGHWFAVTPDGPRPLPPTEPVSGLSWYEAHACAAWAGGRLPHEHEWEAAARAGLLQNTGRAWEWCANPLYPYAGFTPWPYEGYSVPYFDNDHYVLRGGSRYTCRVIKRVTFRNYYQADKRHIFAGVRPVFAD